MSSFKIIGLRILEIFKAYDSHLGQVVMTDFKNVVDKDQRKLHVYDFGFDKRKLHVYDFGFDRPSGFRQKYVDIIWSFIAPG